MRFCRHVYAIRHNVTQKIYIGSSSAVDTRIKSHLNALRRGNHPVEDMQRDYDEHGEDFTITILDTIDCFDVKDKEYFWMQHYQSYKRSKGYNYKDRHNFESSVAVDVKALQGEIKASGINHTRLAERIGITHGQFNYRLYHNRFSVSNINDLALILGLESLGKIISAE